MISKVQFLGCREMIVVALSFAENDSLHNALCVDNVRHGKM